MANEFIARNGVIAKNNSTVTGSLTVTAGITGSLFGTSSWASNSLSALTASYINPLTQNVIITGSFRLQDNSGFFGPRDAIIVDDAAGIRLLYDAFNGSQSIDFGNRTLYDDAAVDTIYWGGIGGEFSTFKYNAQRMGTATRDKLYNNNRQGGQFLDDSYFDINVQNDDLVYLGNTGEWLQVEQNNSAATKMLGIAKNVMSQTGSVLIEGDIVVSTVGGYPIVSNAGYGSPVYIKEGTGTQMDTTIPVTGYVRLLGYCYASYNAGNDWIMKFRPSNDWYVI